MDLKQQPKGSMEYYHIVSNLSESLSFSKDVMYEMGANGVPYSKADFSHLYRTSGLLARVSRSKNIKKAETKVSPLNLPPLHTTYSRSSAAKECVTVPGHQGKVLDSCKITGLGGHSNAYSCLKLVTASDQDGQSRNDKWQDCVLKKLTKTTAQWIVSQQVPRQSQYKAGLQSLLKGQYGSASATDLVTDEHMFEEDFCGLYEVPKCSPDPRVLQSSKVETPLPVYYRSKGGFSQTANDVTVTHMETPRPPCLQESLKPRMGKYVFHTENNFEQELYSGKLNVVQTVNSRYHKYIQDLFPCGPEKWTGSLAVGITEEMDRMGKGAQQWVDLPTKADYATELGPRLPDYSGQDTEVPKQQAHYRPMLKHSLLRYAVEKWRDAWKISEFLMTVEGLKKALTHLHYHVRLVAIATCASAAVNRPQEDQDWEVEAVPPELQPLLLAALHDPERTIQMAAALCQYAIGRPSAHARDILRDILWQGECRDC
uniref:Uncharacterized protein n=1 Tax=Electrophorus electricus TaxID=8005 RepID=A0A4W4GHX2_ELEEL